MQEQFCTKCGATYTPPAPFCTGCGNRLEEEASAAPAPTATPAPQQQYVQTQPAQQPAGPHPQFGNLIARNQGFPQRTLIFTAIAVGAMFLLSVILIFWYGRTAIYSRDLWTGRLTQIGTQWNTGLIIFFLFIDLLFAAYMGFQFYCQWKSEIFVFERGVTGTASGTLVPSITPVSWSYEYGITVATDNPLNNEQLTLTCQGTRRRVMTPNAGAIRDAIMQAQQSQPPQA